MRNIDYYGTKLFLKSMEIGGCVTGLVHEAKNKEDHYCSDHNKECDLCKKEAMQWLNEDFNRITEEEKAFLMMLNENIKFISLNDDSNKITLELETHEHYTSFKWDALFKNRPFPYIDENTHASVEELLKREEA